MKKKAPDALRARLLTRLRKICLRLPASTETVKWGNPTFVAGKKIFAVLDREDCYPAPYSAHQGWVCMDAQRRLDWREIERLLVDSYRQVAMR